MQQIHINRNKINSIEFDSPEITVPLKPGSECSFELGIINYGPPTHVHLSAGGNLIKHITFLQDNPYVADQEWVPVVVTLSSDTPSAEGKIKVTTGYGSYTKSFNVFIGIKPLISKQRHKIDVDTKLGSSQYQKKSIKLERLNINKESYKEKIQELVGYIYDTFPFSIYVLLIFILLLLIIIIFKKISIMYSALAVSIILFVLMLYTIMHVLTRK